MTVANDGAKPTLALHTGAGSTSLDVRRFTLAAVSGPSSGQSFSTGEGVPDVVTVGTHELCSLRLRDPTVSGFHFEIAIEEAGALLRDTGSRNGTVVDGVRVREAFLKSGSLIVAGTTTLAFELQSKTRRLPLSESRQMGRLVGESVAMRRVFALLERVAPTAVTVLLEGETGTGKSAAARTIHELSPRAEQPFVMMDCAAIPGNLLESELFGHERGAFTSADSRRIGAFEEASGGTLFLDEIGELPTDLQPKLLGVLENRSVRRVGGATTIPVDVRILAATNRDLRAEVNAGRFRSDLYFRLAVARLDLPPLRMRSDDIAPLSRELLGAIGADPDQVARVLTPEHVARMKASAWPGNIRELRNYLERCLIFDDAAEPVSPAAGDFEVDISLPLSLARERVLSAFERAYVGRLLERHGHRVVEAAAAAQVDRTYLYRLMRRHGLKT